MRFWLFYLLIPFNIFAVSAQASEKAQAFGKMPLVQQVSVSPDGQFVVGIFQVDGKQVVMTSPFGQHETTPVVSLKFASDRIESVDWVNPKRLLINASRAEYLSGRFYRLHTMYAVNADGTELLEIQNQSVYKKAEHSAMAGLQSTHLLNDLADDNDHVLVTAYDERDQGFGVFKVNVYNSKFSKVESGAGDRAGFATDRAGNVRFSTVLKQQKLSVEFKSAPDAAWQSLRTIDLAGDIDFSPVGLTADGKSVLVNTDYQSDFNYLAEVDLKTAQIGKPLYQVPDHDIDVTYSKAGKLIGYGYTRDFFEQRFIDPQQQQYNEQVKKLFPDRHSYITSYSDDGQRVIIYTVKDNQPGRYLTLDFTTKKAAFWFSQYPHLEKTQLPPVNNFSFKSRDGLQLSGYLTTPLDKDKPAPIILFPHGGPHARDNKGFDPFVQFFTSMGYAVLQVNFRGSSGFGNKFEAAGYQQWGKQMQDDLMDALQAVSANPDVDSGRSCLVGASYGGYAAMVGSYRDSAKFNCFIAISGISDLTAMLRTDGAYNEAMKAVQRTLIGDYEKNSAALDAVSAVSHLDAIKKPMLLIHGVKDTRVSYKQSAELFNALKRRGVAVSYLEQKDGTHFFDTEQERTEAFATMETFLRQYLPL
ncbi:MAG: prolyl oligopeptidase family serine peptidase [Rheinheimera sp.]|nr:prolyl oligopeptidase family serine peptidase [Rheinheimera sp.]